MHILNETIKKEIEEKVEETVVASVSIRDVSPELLIHKTVEAYSKLLQEIGVF